MAFPCDPHDGLPVLTINWDDMSNEDVKKIAAEYHERAPHRHENFAGERVFGYLAELDILGWKFVVRPGGAILIETPIIEGNGQPTISMNDAHRRLLLALFELADGTADGVLGIDPDAPGLGTVR